MFNAVALCRGTLLISLLSYGNMAAAEKTKWLKFTTPNFELYTDAGERKGRDALKRLDQLRQILQSIPQSQNGPLAPLRVYLFDKDTEYRNFKPATAGSGFHATGADRDYLVMRGTGGDTYKTIFHEYTHLVLDRSSVRVPRWIEEGAAEYYSMTEPDGKLRAKLGKAISAHQKMVRRTTQWIKPEVLQALRRNSAEFKEQPRTGMVYAQSWVMTHQLISTDRYKAAIPRFSELLMDGTAYAPAFMTAFGVSVEAAWKDLSVYARANKYAQIRFNLTPDTISSIKGEKVSNADVALPLAELQLVLGNDRHAETILKQVAADTESSEASTALGMLALRRRSFDEAREHFQTAIEQNSELAAPHFGLAIAIKESSGDQQVIAESLRKCAELSPNFAEAHYTLGKLAGASKRYQEAVDHFQRAATAYPKAAVYWQSLAVAHHQLKQTEAARRAAYKAYFASATEEEIAMVIATLELVDGRQVQVAAKKAAVSAAAAVSDRRGDTRLDGTLIRVDCIGEAARFHVLTGEKRVLLHSLRPQEISLKNSSAETREFECGPQKKLSVSVEYNARPDAGMRSVGDVIAIEFKAN